MRQQLEAQFVDIFGKQVYPAIITINDGKIESINPRVVKDLSEAEIDDLPFILPGFVDAHVHIESSMLIPVEFARLAVVHGTVGTVSDPHEIANVCGIEGVEFMIVNGKKCPFKFNYGAPSCVPATTFETAGAEINADAVAALLQRKEVKYLSEMMNFPGVLSGEEQVMKKINAAHKAGKPVDGHAPGLKGIEAKKYADAGITTDHECFTYEEALEKINYGMKILIREGSAAKNFDTLIDLLNDHPGQIMFCSDDKHPDSLVAGHINQLCARAVQRKIDIFNILRAACVNPVEHYKLDIGLLRQGDPADFIVVKNLESFVVLKTFINGELVAEGGRSLIPSTESSTLNQFTADIVAAHDLQVNPVSFPKNESGEYLVIEALDGQLITKKTFFPLKVHDQQLLADPLQDILKIVVVNRYHSSPPSIAFIKNFGLKSGAIASSVAHDSHNIVAVGATDESIAHAIRLIIQMRGGISAVDGIKEELLALPVAGLMSIENGYDVAKKYTAMDRMAKDLGSTLSAPFMTLSFMALLVIPHLKLSDKGLFDGDRFRILTGE